MKRIYPSQMNLRGCCLRDSHRSHVFGIHSFGSNARRLPENPSAVGILAAILSLSIGQAVAFDFQAEVSGEMRTFFQKGLEQQSRHHPSGYVQPEWHFDWNNQNDLIMAKFFYRLDARDAQRTHADIRELAWTHVQDPFEVLVGISKVFWGVAESRHLVDIINQTDLVENLDEEEKLGQPMVKLSWIYGDGSVTGFVLPYFRERTFPGSEGRLRTSPKVAEEFTLYESSKQKKHLDWALRWSHVWGDWDVGVSWFRGTSREPRFYLRTVGEPFLVPVYEVINQISTDIQATKGAWLWKFEGYHRQGQEDDFNAMVAGFEYTHYGLFGGDKDLGMILEYHYDSRNRLSPQPFNDDVAAGFRLTWNDVASTELLAFVLIDRHLSSKFYRVEASRRVGDHLKVGLEGSVFANIAASDPFYALRQDNYLQLNLTYYF